MFLFKGLKRFILTCLLTTVTVSVNAHTLKETTAQVILRDGQVEVRMITDIDHFIATLQNEQAWLMGDTDAVMPTNLNISDQEAFIKNVLKQTTRLTINKKEIGFERIVLVNNHSSHSDEIIFQAKHQVADVHDVSISFHKSLGTVHVSLVKPQYKLLVAGESGFFSLK